MYKGHEIHGLHCFEIHRTHVKFTIHTRDKYSFERLHCFFLPRAEKSRTILLQIKFVSLQHPWGEIHGSRMRFLLYPDKPKSGKFQ